LRKNNALWEKLHPEQGSGRKRRKLSHSLRFYCTVCCSGFTRHRDVTRHQRQKHPNELWRLGNEIFHNIQQKNTSPVTCDVVSVKLLSIDVSYINCWKCTTRIPHADFPAHAENCNLEVGISKTEIMEIDTLEDTIEDSEYPDPSRGGPRPPLAITETVQFNREIIIPAVAPDTIARPQEEDTILWSSIDPEPNSSGELQSSAIIIESTETIGENNARYFCSFPTCNRNYSRARDAKRHERKDHGMNSENPPRSRVPPIIPQAEIRPRLQEQTAKVPQNNPVPRPVFHAGMPPVFQHPVLSHPPRLPLFPPTTQTLLEKAENSMVTNSPVKKELLRELIVDLRSVQQQSSHQQHIIAAQAHRIAQLEQSLRIYASRFPFPK